MRYAEFDNPSIYSTTVTKDAILFFTNDRDEDEYVLDPHQIEAQFLMQANQDIADKIEAIKADENEAFRKELMAKNRAIERDI